MKVPGHTEQQGCQCSTDGVPAAKDQRREGNKAQPAGHVLTETTHRNQGEVGATDSCHSATGQHVDDPGAVDVDTDGVRRLGVLAYRPHAQSPAGAEQPKPQSRDKDQHEVTNDGLAEQGGPNDGNFREQRDREVGKVSRLVVDGGAVDLCLHDFFEEEASQTGHQNV